MLKIELYGMLGIGKEGKVSMILNKNSLVLGNKYYKVMGFRLKILRRRRKIKSTNNVFRMRSRGRNKRV